MNLPTYITFDTLTNLNSLLKNRKVAILVDENTKRYCYPILQQVITQEHLLIEISAGEKHKSLDTCTHIWNELTKANFDRKSIVLNLGGGVIGDMGGFCASTYKRGIDFIQLPTTLLSQVDASVGGKLGIDFNGFKNHIGVFKQPLKVWIHTHFLETLPRNELYSGFAEVIKHTLIADQTAFTKLLASNFDELVWSEIIAHSVALKAQVTENDPYEKGQRKILNFGHTIGHAIESYFLEEQYETAPFLHGEAIALGMIAESYFSMYKGFISVQDFEQIKGFITLHYTSSIAKFKEYASTDEVIDKIIKWAMQDKKNEASKILTVALEAIGKAIFDVELTPQEAKKCLAILLV